MNLMAKSQVYLGFLCWTILLFCLQVGVTVSEDLLTTSPSVLTTQSPTSQNPMDASTTTVSQEVLTTLASQETTAQITTFEFTSTVQTTTPPTELFTSQAPSPETPLVTTLPPHVPTSSHSVTGPDQESVTLGEKQTNAEVCEENNKRLMMICLIVIGVLVFLCVCLLLVIVIMASKLSYIKKSQTSRRFPRSNGDFLSASSLWPIGLETLQRVTAETPETSLISQGAGLERTTAGQGKIGDETSRKLAREISTRQKHKEMSPEEISTKPHNSTTTKVEI